VEEDMDKKIEDIQDVLRKLAQELDDQYNDIYNARNFYNEVQNKKRETEALKRVNLRTFGMTEEDSS